ncbi:hypothetical protein GCM10009600_21630 [Oerskovia paurometabola]
MGPGVLVVICASVWSGAGVGRATVRGVRRCTVTAERLPVPGCERRRAFPSLYDLDGISRGLRNLIEIRG